MEVMQGPSSFHTVSQIGYYLLAIDPSSLRGRIEYFSHLDSLFIGTSAPEAE